MSTLVLELHHLPLVSYFSQLKKYDTLLIESQEHYQKQSLRNRTHILTANGELVLTVPILHGATLIKDVRIDYSQSWVKNHVRGITSSYKHSPYFDYYFPYLEDIYHTKPTFLYDLNFQMFQLLLKFLKMPIQVTETHSWQETYPSLIDERMKNQYRGECPNRSYSQVFGQNFHQNLSIIDLIFNQGPNSLDFI